MNKRLSSLVWGRLKHLCPNDALERVIDSVSVLLGFLVTLLILGTTPASILQALAIGFSLTCIGFCVRALVIGHAS